mgnify:FL=1
MTIDQQATSEGIMIRRAFRSTHPRPSRTSRGHGATKADLLKDIGARLRNRRIAHTAKLPPVDAELGRILARLR